MRTRNKLWLCITALVSKCILLMIHINSVLVHVSWDADTHPHLISIIGTLMDNKFLYVYSVQV